jgi:hypothetical protein
MRSMFRTLMVALLAVFALGTVASASASAAICEKGDEAKNEYTPCVKKAGVQKELEAPNKLEGTGGESNALEFKIAGVKGKVTCKSSKLSGTPADAGFTGYLTFENCKMIEPTKCKLSSVEEREIIYAAKGNLEAPPGSPVKITLVGRVGEEEFASMTFEDNMGTPCSGFGGTWHIWGNTGTGCTFDTAIASFAFEHELICKKEGQKVRMGANFVSFTTTAKIKTSTKEEFALLES